MEFDDFNASNYPPAESVLQAEAVFTQSGPHDAEEARLADVVAVLAMAVAWLWLRWLRWL